MWGRKEDPVMPATNPSGEQATSERLAPSNAAPSPPTRPVGVSGGIDQRGREMAQIGKSLRLKGEITGSEDLLVNGEVEGAIELKENSLTVGPNGSVKADVSARSITVMGHLCGNVRAGEKIEICKTGSLEGDLSTARIVIEDGAVFRGSIDIVKPGQADADARRKAVPIVESPKSSAAGVGRGATITPQQATLPSRNP
jgi:cytoskeletal protein CcmA (bactofilin family)